MLTGKMSTKSIRCDPDGGRASMKIERDGLYPVNAPAQLCAVWTGGIKPWAWGALAEGREGKTLRQLAQEYTVSHEAVRRTLKASQEVDKNTMKHRRAGSGLAKPPATVRE